MKFSDLKSLLGIHFVYLDRRLQETGVREMVETKSKLCFLEKSNDFLAVWPSKVTGNWFRVVTLGEKYIITPDADYKKAVHYHSDSKTLYLIDGKPLPKKPVVPPL